MRDTSHTLHSSQYWFARAEECRALADTFHNETTREKMIQVAQDYERMAVQAAGRELAATVNPRAKVGAE
jgi:hypothetical protein